MTDSSILTGSITIEINRLNKRYNTQPVLKDLSLTVAGGEICVLVGANGAGKSTLLRILATLTRADSGEVRLNGIPLSSDPILRREIGYLGHQSLFYGDLTACENLRHYARLYQLSNPEEVVQNSLESARLTLHRQKPVRTFSRGMLQRLAIERTLIHQPRLLLLDEPFTGLDQEAAETLDERLDRLHTQECTLIVVAHRPQRLLEIATHIAWLRNGRIEQKISVTQLSSAPDLSRYIREVK
jgi:heme exporter protein A